MPRLPRRGDDLGVVAVGEHHAPPARPRLALADRRVEVLGSRDLEPLHSAGQHALVAGLDQQVDVRPLDAELHDAEVLAQRRGQRGFPDRLVHAAAAQVADGAHDPQDHVNRVPGMQERPLLVRRAGPLAVRRPAGPAPLATARLPQRKLLWLGAPRLAAVPDGLLDGHAVWLVDELRSGNRFRRYFCGSQPGV